MGEKIFVSSWCTAWADRLCPWLQAETLELAFDDCELSEQAMQDLAELLGLSLRLRHMPLLDVLPSMLHMTSGVTGLEELALVNISGMDADLGPHLQVGVCAGMPFSCCIS